MLYGVNPIKLKIADKISECFIGMSPEQSCFAKYVFGGIDIIMKAYFDTFLLLQARNLFIGKFKKVNL